MTDYTELSDEELSRRVAEALGWRLASDERIKPLIYHLPTHNERFGWPPYATDWSLTGPLIEQHNLALFLEVYDNGEYSGWWLVELGPGHWMQARTALKAICGAILAIKGDKHDSE